MLLRVPLIAAAMAIGSAAVAQAPRGGTPSPVPLQSGRTDVVLASAEAIHAPAPESAQPSPAPTKRRIARVTTCRCGDPQPDPHSQDQ
jgi:hypothetical protein